MSWTRRGPESVTRLILPGRSAVLPPDGPGGDAIICRCSLTFLTDAPSVQVMASWCPEVPAALGGVDALLPQALVLGGNDRHDGDGHGRVAGPGVMSNDGVRFDLRLHRYILTARQAPGSAAIPLRERVRRDGRMLLRGIELRPEPVAIGSLNGLASNCASAPSYSSLRKSVDAESEVVRASGPSLGTPAPPPSERGQYRGFGLSSATRVSGGVARPGGLRSGPASRSRSGQSGSGPGRARPGRPLAGWVGVCCTPIARRP